MFGALKRGLQSLGEKLGLSKPKEEPKEEPKQEPKTEIKPIVQKIKKFSENLESKESKFPQNIKSHQEKDAILTQEPIFTKPIEVKKEIIKEIKKEIPKSIEPIQQEPKEEIIEEPLNELKKEIIPQEIKQEIEQIKKQEQIIEKKVEEKKEVVLEIPKVQEEVIEEPKLEKKVSIFTKIKSVFSEKYQLSDNELNDLIDVFELSMLQSDVSLQVVDILKKSLKDKLKKEGVAKNNQDEYLKQIFLDIIFENYPEALNENFFKQDKKPFTILFVGTNGSGKTTNIAKLAYYLKSKSKTCVLAASDTYRAAAIDQLEGHANALSVPIIKGKYGQDPASVAYDAVAYAKTKNLDFVLVDSSGRQDNALNLMKELEKIKNVVKPDYIVFVAEAIAGQTALMQAESFNKYTNFNAFILTKTDVDEKGGTLLSISLGLKKPVLFLGIGQEYKDIAFFNKEFLEKVI